MDIKVRRRLCVLAMGSSMLAVAPAAIAAPQPHEVAFQVSGGTLDNALTQVAAQSGRQILFDPAQVRGRAVSGLSGAMTPEAAVRQLLAGTGLALRIDDKGQWLVVRIAIPTPVAAGKVLGAVRVTTGADRLGYVGANGSSDPLATEGTKSYTTNATAIASKQPLTLKETPEAVSVITRQQLDDRALNSFDSTLAAMPGVTVSATKGGSTATALYSRGFEINNVQIDGGSPLSIGATNNYTSNRQIVDDFSEYDSVTLQRGASGQFTGVGGPGGVISLERKRPLDHEALSGLVQAGSWGRYRVTLDASSPVWLNGLVRARTVLAAERNDEFYDIASRRFWQGYANIEIDPTASTAINIGGSLNHQRATPFNGLPTDGVNGGLIDFARSTCYCTSWSRSVVDGKELFVQLTQKIGKDWTFRVNGSANLQKINANLLNYDTDTAGIDPSDSSSVSENYYRSRRKSDQYVVDSFVNGKFRLFGVGFDLTTGVNYQRVNQKVSGGPELYYYYDATAAQMLAFDPADFPQPAEADLEPGAQTTPVSYQRQYGVYGTLRISPKDWIHLTVGERYTHYQFGVVQLYDYGDSSFSVSSNSKYNVWSPPNVGLVIDVSKNTSAFANYVNIFDRYNYYDKAGKLVPPTTGVNVDAGLKQELAGGKLNLSGSLFYIKQINLPQVEPGTDPSQSSDNGSSCCYFADGSKAISKGVDVQLQGQLTKRLNVDLSYVYNDFRYVKGSTGLAYAQQLTQPEHLVKLWAAWQPPILNDNLLLGAGLHVETGVTATATAYVYDRPTRTFVQKDYFTPRDGYVTAEAMIKYRLKRNANIQLNINNLLDEKYYATVRTGYGNFYGTPRSFLLTLQVAM